MRFFARLLCCAAARAAAISSRWRQHRLIDVHVLRLPQEDTPYHEGVAQVVNARSVMRPAIAPAQLLAQRREDPMDLALVQILASSPAPRGDKK
jgi:hypothetical protein